MKILSFYLLLAFTLLSCDFGSDKQKEKQWVFAEIVTESKTDTTEYFYFGQMNKSVIDEIDNDLDRKGMFKLSNVRLWNNDNLLETYEDEQLSGDLLFKIEDVEELTLYKDDPIYFYDKDRLHESALKLIDSSRVVVRDSLAE